MFVGSDELLGAFLKGLEEKVINLAHVAIEQRLAETPQLQPKEHVSSPFLSVRELAQYLRLGTPDKFGRRPGGERTIRQWVKEGVLPYRRAGDRLLFYLPEIHAWLDDQTARRSASRRPKQQNKKEVKA